jgi:hypothetical protein
VVWVESQAAADGSTTYYCEWDHTLWDLSTTTDDVIVTYVEPDGDWVSNAFQSLNLIMNVNYGHDWVQGAYAPGYTLWLTVTESDSTTEKATAELQTQEIPWWGGRTGFSTDLGDPWNPERPDIQAYDWIYGEMDNGYTSTERMGPITATAPWDPNQGWMPSILPGNVLEWGWGTMWSDSWWRFEIVAQITDTVELGQVMINTVEAQSLGPEDVDPLPGNNSFDLVMAIEEYQVCLPVVFRSYKP